MELLPQEVASVRMMIQKGYQGLAEYMIEKRKK